MEKRIAEKPVVTGQQIGLLGGPLFTTFKVLGALQLASKIGSKAVYWLETNDADFNEINYIEYIDANGNLTRLTWDIDSQGYSVGAIVVDRKLVFLVGAFFDSLRQTEFTPKLKKMALDAYAEGKTLSQASAELADSIFGRFNLEIFDPRNPHFLESSRDLLVREAERTREGEQCNLFCMINNRRVAVFREKSGYRDRNGQPIDLSRYNLVPNVKTRNLLQDSYFNTHTYVAGPSEVQYIRDLDDMYRLHRVSKPDIRKRMSAVLVEPGIRRILKKHAIDLPVILNSDKEDFIREIIKQQSGFDHKEAARASEKLTRDFLAGLEKLGLDVKAVEGPLKKAVRESVGKQRAQSKQSVSSMLNRIQTVFTHLKPRGKKQERVLNLFYFLNLYGGIDFVDWLYDHYDTDQDILEIKV